MPRNVDTEISIYPNGCGEIAWTCDDVDGEDNGAVQAHGLVKIQSVKHETKFLKITGCMT